VAAALLFKAFRPTSNSPNRTDLASVSATAPLGGSESYHTVSIEDLAVGDTVLARDPATGRVQEKRVVRVYRRLSDHLRVLQIRGPDGTSRQLKTTDEHPFWVAQDNDFKGAAELRPGDDFAGPDGEPQTLVSTYREDRPDGVPVYNVETEDYHTYFVAAHGTRAPPMLVHNCGASNSAARRELITYYPPNRGFLRDPVPETLTPGTRISRYGGFLDEAGEFKDFGTFVAPDDVPLPMRALPRGSEARPYTVYEVLKPMEDVPSGPAAPWFGQIGLGKQLELPLPIQDLIEQGFIRPLTRVIPGS
jgi:hypothetical protein